MKLLETHEILVKKSFFYKDYKLYRIIWGNSGDNFKRFLCFTTKEEYEKIRNQTIHDLV